MRSTGSGAEEGLEALARFLLGGEVARSCQGLGTMLRCQKALQGQGLLDAEAGELVAGLRHFQGAGGISGAGHGVDRAGALSASTPSAIWPCSRAARLRPAYSSSQRSWHCAARHRRRGEAEACLGNSCS